MGRESGAAGGGQGRAGEWGGQEEAKNKEEEEGQRS